MSEQKQKKLRPRAIIFVGFRHKTDTIESVKEAGYKTILFTKQQQLSLPANLFDEVIELDILDRTHLETVITQIKPRYNVKSIISNYEHFVVPRSFIAEHLGIPSCSVYSACATRNKALQRHALKFMPENVDSRLVTTQSQALKAFKALGEDVYFKVISGVKSGLVFHCRTKEDVENAFITTKQNLQHLQADLLDDYQYCDFQFSYPSPKTHFLVEKAEAGTQITIASLTNSHRIWHAPSACDIYTAKDIGREDSFLAFRITPSRADKTTITKAKKVTETAMRILGMQHCCAHAELIIKPDGSVKLIEIASRMGGYRAQMYETAYGLRLNNLLVKAVIGKTIKTRKAPLQYVSQVEIFAQETGTLQQVNNFDILSRDPLVKNLRQKKVVGDTVGKAKDGYENILSFMVTGKTYEEVYQKSLYYQEFLSVVTEPI